MIFHYLNRRIRNFNSIIYNKNVKKDYIEKDHSTNDKKLTILPYIKDITEPKELRIDKFDTILGFRCLNRLNRFIRVQKDKNNREECNGIVQQS